MRQRNNDPPAQYANGLGPNLRYQNGKKQRHFGNGVAGKFAFIAPVLSHRKFSSILVVCGGLLMLWFFGSLLPSVSFSTRIDDGPPSDLVVHGKRDVYTRVPPQYRKTAWIGLQTDTHLPRAYRSQGWMVSKEEKDLYAGNHQILYKRKVETTDLFQVGKPWQRLSRIPGCNILESKDTFLQGFRKLQATYDATAKKLRKKKTKRNVLKFLPETYRLVEEADRKTFTDVITQDKANNRNRPWVLKKVKVNNGKGIEMIPPDSPALYSAVDRSIADEENTYIVQAYICNELTWFRGEKFDLRFYWLVASVDPLIVLYHDGYARVGGAQYNETDWGSTGQHLTNHAYRRGTLNEDVLADAFWRRVQEYYNANKGRLSKIILGNDPVQHIRNQMKEAIATTAEAFYDTLTLKTWKKRVTTENMFAFFGADFIIDADLDVYYVEAQTAPGLGDGYDYRVQLFREMFRPMVNIVAEIQEKQEQNAKGNILPLTTLEGWEMVNAGTEWRYEYKGYERSRNKRGCALSTTP